MTPTDRSQSSNNNLLTPRSIAVIGASRDPEKIGHQILLNILKGGFQGSVYPVNPKAEDILELRSYKSVVEIPAEVDLAVIVIPAQFVPEVMKECATKKVSTVVIISAGFKETGDEGFKLEKEVAKIANEANINVIGPNCLGFMNTDIKLNATFSATTAKSGNIILFSQSGAFGTAILDWANKVNLGFKYFISIGNKAVVDENYLLDLFVNELKDDNQNLIFAGYLEDFKNGQSFMRLASQLSQNHPIIILKPGKSEQGSKAISSHTGSMTTQDAVVEAALKQSNCIRVNGIEEMFDTIQVLSRQSLPRGNKVAIITNAGGPSVAATDQVEASLLEMADISETTRYTLQHQLPPAASVHNPIDVLGDAKADRYDKAIEAAALDENVDIILTLLTPQAVTEVEKTAGVITEKYRKYPFKPIVAVFIGGETTAKGIDILNQYQMPIFDNSEDAVRVLSNIYRYKANLDKKPYPPEITLSGCQRSADLTDEIIVGEKSESIVNSCGIDVPKSVFLPPRKTTPEISTSIGFPVVAKIASPKLLHKTEFDAVRLSIASQKELEDAIQELHKSWMDNFGTDTDYQIQIQKMLKGQDLIIGFKRDPNFGPAILFGAGGIFTELFKDTSQRIVPIDPDTAREMILETKTSEMLKGFRGQKPYDFESVVNAIVRVSQIAVENPQIKEFDINPFIVLEEGCGGYAVDVKIITSKEK